MNGLKEKETEKTADRPKNSLIFGILFIVIGILIGGTLSYIYLENFSQIEKAPESSTITVTLIIDFGNNTTMVFENITPEDPTAYGLLMECAKPEHGNFTVKSTYYAAYDSMFVEAIEGVENGDNGKYWQYYVNGELPMVGANKYVLKDGDIVKWVFEVPEWS